MKQLMKKITGLAAVFALVATTMLVPAASVSAVQTAAGDCDQGVSGGVSAGLDCADNGEVPTDLFGGDSIFTTIVNILLFVIGAVSVIMLIWGGIRYTTSGGNSASVTAAKNTIMYAIIGLVVAFLAFAIVNWVLASLMP